MTTPSGPPPPPPERPRDLTFVASDLGRDEEQVEQPRPRAVARAARTAASTELPWMVRDGAAPAPDARSNDSPWAVRRTEHWQRHVTSTMRRLRQEAVNLSWTAAWLAVSNSERRRRR